MTQIRIDFLGRYNLYGLKGLLYLDVRNLNLTVIESSLFDSFENIEFIGLNQCQVKRIDSWTFSNMSSLEEIDLFQNQIEIIQANAFNNLNRIKFIDLRWNPIKKIELNAFYDLKHDVKIDKFYLTDPNDANDSFLQQFNEIKRVYRLFRVRKVNHIDFYQSISVKNIEQIEINCELTIRMLREFKILVYQIDNDKKYLDFISKCKSFELII